MMAKDSYSQALRDPAFRQQQLEDARFHRKLAISAAIGAIVGWLGYVSYCGIMQHRWPGDLGVGFALVMCAMLYSQARTKIVALEAMPPEGSNQVAQPAPNRGPG